MYVLSFSGCVFRAPFHVVVKVGFVQGGGSVLNCCSCDHAQTVHKFVFEQWKNSTRSPVFQSVAEVDESKAVVDGARKTLPWTIFHLQAVRLF